MTSSVVAGVASLMLLDVSPAAAQAPGGSNPWQPWIGCWSAAPPRFVDLNAEPQQVCVVPAGASAVELVTVTGSTIASRERIDADGERWPIERDGCTGWEQARWSADRRRVYLQSEQTCAGGLTRATTGLMAMAANGDWLDVVGVSTSGRAEAGVRMLRHRPSPPLATLPADIASAVARDSRAPIELKTLLPIGDAEIIDASKHVDGAVIEAWLAGNRQAFTMNAARLKALSAAGVDDRVIDVLVALSYPRAFSIRPSPTAMGALAIEGGGGPPAMVLGGLGLVGGYVFDCDPYFYGLPPSGPIAGCPSFYPTYGFGPWDYYGGGWYFAGGGGGIIIEPTPPAQAPSHGQVVNGRGYISGESSSSGGSASGGGSSSSGSSGSGGGFSGASSGGGGGERTAVPR